MKDSDINTIKNWYNQSINSGIETVAEESASHFDWFDEPPQSLRKETGSEKRAKFKAEIKNILQNEDELAEINEGLHIIVNNLGRVTNEKACLQELDDEGLKMGEFLIENLQKLSKQELQSKEENIDTSKRVVSVNDIPTLASKLGITDQVFHSFYEIGAALSKENKWKDASKVFLFLSMLDATRYEVWLARGLCHKHLKEWFFAVSAFSIASMIHPIDPVSYIFAAECFIELRDKENTLGSLELAEYFNKQVHDSLITDKIRELKAQI